MMSAMAMIERRFIFSPNPTVAWYEYETPDGDTVHELRERARRPRQPVAAHSAPLAVVYAYRLAM